ncbi:MAG: hypothetical protein JOZ17_15315 [Acetobacteraceae bacterium]|nr:hypothetical protein [Acetobacteraceae bacterium]
MLATRVRWWRARLGRLKLRYLSAWHIDDPTTSWTPTRSVQRRPGARPASGPRPHQSLSGCDLGRRHFQLSMARPPPQRRKRTRRHGASLLDIGTVLGHRSQQTTKRYEHLTESRLRDLIEQAAKKHNVL